MEVCSRDEPWAPSCSSGGVRKETLWTMMFAEEILMRRKSREEHPERRRFGRERTGVKASQQRTEDVCG